MSVLSLTTFGGCDSNAADPSGTASVSAPHFDAPIPGIDDFRGLPSDYFDEASFDLLPKLGRNRDIGNRDESFDLIRTHVYDRHFEGDQATQRRIRLYMPDREGPHPWVAYIHGGGLTKVGPTAGETFAEHLVEKGYAVALIGYRLSPLESSTDPTRIRHPDHVRDVAQAIEFLVRRSSRIGLDPDRRAIMGHSAGAHVAGILMTNPTFLGEYGLSTADWKAGILIDTEGYRLDDIVHRDRPTMPAITRNVYGVDRTRTPRFEGEHPVGYNEGPLYDHGDEGGDPADGSWLYPALLSAEGEPERYAEPAALNLSPYYNIEAGDPVSPLLLVHGTAPRRYEAAIQMADVANRHGFKARVLTTSFNHGQLVHLFGSSRAPAYTRGVVSWLHFHVRDLGY